MANGVMLYKRTGDEDIKADKSALGKKVRWLEKLLNSWMISDNCPKALQLGVKLGVPLEIRKIIIEDYRFVLTGVFLTDPRKGWKFAQSEDNPLPNYIVKVLCKIVVLVTLQGLKVSFANLVQWTKVVVQTSFRYAKMCITRR